MICLSCDKTRETKSDRLPAGWKRIGEEILCKECLDRRYVLRAVTLPVAEPISGDWKEFDETCKQSWAMTTNAANWMTTEIYARDIRRNGQEKMPPMPRIYLYPEARERFPALSSQTVASLEQSMLKRYRAKRFDVIWTCAATLPNHRYPTPLPIPNQAWSIRFDDGGRPVWSGRIGDRRWELRLKGGVRYRRQIGSVQEIVAGTAMQGEAALYRQGNHTVIKMVTWLPRREPREAEGVLYVRTDEDALLVALDVKGERMWTLCWDHIRQWTAEHRRQLHRWAKDSKAEERPDPSFSSRRREAVAKFDQRMSSAVNEAAAQLANFARRRKYASVVYNDDIRTFCEDFRWFALKARLTTKLDDYGIGFESGAAVEEAALALAED